MIISLTHQQRLSLVLGVARGSNAFRKESIAAEHGLHEGGMRPHTAKSLPNNQNRPCIETCTQHPDTQHAIPSKFFIYIMAAVGDPLAPDVTLFGLWGGEFHMSNCDLLVP